MTLPRRQLVSIGQRRNTRPVEYSCSNCQGVYTKTTEVNAWWAAQRDSCPHCSQLQYPTIDIEAPLNAMELDPNIFPLYVSAGAENGGDSCVTPLSQQLLSPSPHMTPNLGQRLGPSYQPPTSPSPSAGDQLVEGKASSRTLRNKDAAQLIVLMAHAR